MPSVTVHAPELAGETGLFLFLRAASNGTLLNAGGDALTESPTGVFTATVAETVSAIHHARVHSSSTENASTSLRDGWLPAGGTLVQDSYPASGTGGSGDASQTTLLEVQATVEDIAASLAGAETIEVTSRVSGSTITAYIGDDYRVRSGTELTLTVSDPAGGLYTKLNAIGVDNLDFGASRGGRAAGEITGTVESLSYASNVLTIVVEIIACGASLVPDEYTYQIQSSQEQGTETDDFVELVGSLFLEQRTVAARG